MKRIVSIILCLVFFFCLCGCSAADTDREFKQEMTIVTLPSPPKCKTTDNINVINEVLSLLRDIEKSPIEGDTQNGGWSIMIKLNVDGESFNYTMGETLYTASNGEQYAVNGTDAITRIREIYAQLNEPEKDYP